MSKELEKAQSATHILGVEIPKELKEHNEAIPHDHPHRALATKFVSKVWGKNKMEGMRLSDKYLGTNTMAPEANKKSELKGVNLGISQDKPGQSIAGMSVRSGGKDTPKKLNTQTVKDLKAMPKPNLPKSENLDKDGFSGGMGGMSGMGMGMRGMSIGRFIKPPAKTPEHSKMPQTLKAEVQPSKISDPIVEHIRRDKNLPANINGPVMLNEYKSENSEVTGRMMQAKDIINHLKNKKAQSKLGNLLQPALNPKDPVATEEFYGKQSKMKKSENLEKAKVYDFSTGKMTHDTGDTDPKAVGQPAASLHEAPEMPEDSTHPLDTIAARYPDNPPESWQKANEAVHDEPYMFGDAHNITWRDKSRDHNKTHSKELWNSPIPMPAREVGDLKGVLGKGVPKANGPDPFAWMDSKHKATQKVLKEHAQKPLQIHTRSDLIARNDYMNLLNPEMHEVNIHIPAHGDDRLSRQLEPGTPSIKRRLDAYDKLKGNGIPVKLIYDKLTHPNMMPMAHNMLNGSHSDLGTAEAIQDWNKEGDIIRSNNEPSALQRWINENPHVRKNVTPIYNNVKISAPAARRIEQATGMDVLHTPMKQKIKRSEDTINDMKKSENLQKDMFRPEAKLGSHALFSHNGIAARIKGNDLHLHSEDGTKVQVHPKLVQKLSPSGHPADMRADHVRQIIDHHINNKLITPKDNSIGVSVAHKSEKPKVKDPGTLMNKADEKGVHKPINDLPGKSKRGLAVRHAHELRQENPDSEMANRLENRAKILSSDKIKDLKTMSKPNLPKSENMNKGMGADMGTFNADMKMAEKPMNEGLSKLCKYLKKCSMSKALACNEEKVKADFVKDPKEESMSEDAKKAIIAPSDKPIKIEESRPGQANKESKQEKVVKSDLEKAKIIDFKSGKTLADLPTEKTPRRSSVDSSNFSSTGIPTIKPHESDAAGLAEQAKDMPKPKKARKLAAKKPAKTKIAKNEPMNKCDAVKRIVEHLHANKMAKADKDYSKGVHRDIDQKGTSWAGQQSRNTKGNADIKAKHMFQEKAQNLHSDKLNELKAMPKPNLPKSEKQ